MLELLKNFYKEEEGAEIVEYALVLGFIVLVFVAVAPGIRTSLNTIFTNISSALVRATTSS